MYSLPLCLVWLFSTTLEITLPAVSGILVPQAGKLNMSQSYQGWSCSGGCFPSTHCHLPRCTRVQFPVAFRGSGQVHVHVSLSHGEQFSRVHSPAAMWVQSVTTRSFEVCARESGIGSNGTGIINWLAFQDHPKVIHGSVIFNGIWTTETKCDKVTFSQSFGGKPSVFVSAKYTRATKPDDSMYVWLENVDSGSFEMCIREFLPFDGKHHDTIVDWLVFHGNGSEFNFTKAGVAFFLNNGKPTEKDNYGFCQQVQFNTTFYESPVVLVSVHHVYNLQQSSKNFVLPENNIITSWVEEVTLTSMRICVKDLSRTGSKHDPLSVSYVVIGDLNPCLGVYCPSFGVCKTYSAHEARCECFKDCPSYQDPVCTANGTTYDNKCWHELNYCEGLENNLVYHPGSCEGFPIERGRVKLLRVPKWSDSSCETVIFPPFRFYPDKIVHVQIAINHMNLNDSKTVHDAITSWTENVNTQNFTVCAMQSGRKRKNFNPFATVDWLAYQGAPPHGMTGQITMQEWWSGTNCADVNLPKDKFKEAPVVLATAEHLRTGKEYDAALLWTEDVTKSSAKICLRELQNFDGKHEDIIVNWLAFSKRPKPFFAEHGSVTFSNTEPPTDENNNAYCKLSHFTRSYDATPTVVISANHSTTAQGNSAPVHNGITTWIEDMNTTGFRVCVKELYETRYDPVSVSYAVLTDICDPGWSYFNGYCYFTSEICSNWTTALNKCRQENSVLVDISSNEENVYIQHRHNGERTWLGLNDKPAEGNFTWADRGKGNFTAWAKNQPNNFKEEDCVHALGVKDNYEWNDVRCSDCHQFTCKKDLNECETKANDCDQDSLLCSNERGSYSCTCNNGAIGDDSKCYYASCSIIKKYVSDLSGKFVIDPDGAGGLGPFTVHCDMSDKNGVGVTVIGHDSETRTYVPDSSNHKRNVHYTRASLSQLASLTRVSSHCEQFIRWECHNSYLSGNTWWVSRDSVQMSYWGGASPGSGKCACGMTNSCANHYDRCNCDSNDSVLREDSGFLTDKTSLPVKQMKFGDVGGSEYGYYTLGKLKCYGIE